MTGPFHNPSSFPPSVPQPRGQTASERTCGNDQGEGGGGGGQYPSTLGGCRARAECLMLRDITQCKCII